MNMLYVSLVSTQQTIWRQTEEIHLSAVDVFAVSFLQFMNHIQDRRRVREQPAARCWAICKFLVQCVTLTSYFLNWIFQFKKTLGPLVIMYTNMYQYMAELKIA